MVLLALYLLVRYLLLGTPLGGYKEHSVDLESTSAFLAQQYSTLRPLLTPIWAPDGTATLALVMEIGSLTVLALGLLGAWLNGQLRWYLFCSLWLLASLVPLLPFHVDAESQRHMRMMYSPAAPYTALLAFSLVQACAALGRGRNARVARVVAGGLGFLLAGLFLNLLSTNQRPYVTAGQLSPKIIEQGCELLQQDPQGPKVLYELPSWLDHAPLCLNGSLMFEPPFGTGSRAPYRAYVDDDYATFLTHLAIGLGIPSIAYFRYDLASERFVRAAVPKIVREAGQIVADAEGNFLWEPRGIPVRSPNHSVHDIAYKPIEVDALLIEGSRGLTMVIARIVGP
jgi:hypothetical protein